MAGQAFDDLADAYDAMIDWPRRLGAEEPFYRQLFEQVAAGSVLDAACGTGRHAAMFHSWGLRVEGADLSGGMIARCRGHFGESDRLGWVVRGYDQPAGEPGRFDVAICTGNSLALAPDMATVERAVGRMLEAVRPGGAIVLQVLNLWRMADGPCTWQKCKQASLPRGDSLIVKGVHRCGGSRVCGCGCYDASGRCTGHADRVAAVLGPAAGGPGGDGEAGWRDERGVFRRLQATGIRSAAESGPDRGGDEVRPRGPRFSGSL